MVLSFWSVVIMCLMLSCLQTGSSNTWKELYSHSQNCATHQLCNHCEQNEVMILSWPFTRAFLLMQCNVLESSVKLWWRGRSCVKMWLGFVAKVLFPSDCETFHLGMSSFEVNLFSEPEKQLLPEVALFCCEHAYICVDRTASQCLYFIQFRHIVYFCANTWLYSRAAR